MNKKIFLIFAVILLVGTVLAQEIDWTVTSISENQDKFKEDFKLEEISGDWKDVTYDKENGIITNGGVPLKLTELQGKKVEALEKGGFLVENPSKGIMEIGGNKYDSQTVNFLADNVVEVPKGTSVTTADGAVIKADSKLEFSGDSVKTTGKVEITKGNKFASGKDLTYHYSGDASAIKNLEGNHVYLGDDFALKGHVDVAVTDGKIKNSYSGDHKDTFVQSQGKDISVENPGKFSELTTIAHSNHEFLLKNKNSGKEVTADIKIKYLASEEGKNKIFATGMGSLGEAAKLRVDEKQNPGVDITFGDKKALLGDHLYIEEVVINPRKPERTDIEIGKPEQDDKDYIAITKTETKPIPGVKTSTQYYVNSEEFERLKEGYRKYSGIDSNKLDDFIYAANNMEQSKLVMDIDLMPGMSSVGKVTSLFGASTDPDEVLRKRFTEMGSLAGLRDDELVSYNNLVYNEKTKEGITTSDRVIFENTGGTTQLRIERDGKSFGTPVTLSEESTQRMNELSLRMIYADEKNLKSYKNHFSSLLE